MTPADPSVARVIEAMDMLHLVGTADDTAVCEKFLDHPLHALRWQALRTALGLGHTDAVALLQGALDDPHPHNRRMAAQVLRTLDPDRGGPA